MSQHQQVPALARPGSTTGSASEDPLLTEVSLDGLVNLRICVPELQVCFFVSDGTPLSMNDRLTVLTFIEKKKEALFFSIYCRISWPAYLLATIINPISLSICLLDFRAQLKACQLLVCTYFNL
jgi:hypothetical protein